MNETDAAQLRDEDRRAARRLVGWAHPEMKWLTDEAARRATAERDDLLAAIRGELRSSFGDNKLHLGDLSPGCVKCGEGTWSCQFVSRRCTADCFFCPQFRKVDREPDPSVRGITFETPQIYVDWLEEFGFRGAAFTGGEPLLVFDRVLATLREIRARLGREIYLWMYTNGDLLDRSKLELLRDEGLDEIRFNISARKFDLGPVELAASVLDCVTVEIPAIPEELDAILASLRPLSKLGVRYLNLHQLNSSIENYRAYVNRGYTFLQQPLLPILDSELTALKVMKYAVEEGIDLAINYCSCAYKSRVQEQGHRRRAALRVRAGYETVTEPGYLRRLTVKGAPDAIERLVAGIAPDAGLWARSDPGPGLYVHGSLLARMDLDGCRVAASYFDVSMADSPRGDGWQEHPPIRLNGDKSVGIFRTLVAEGEGLGPIGALAFQRMYGGEEDVNAVCRWFTHNYDFGGDGSFEDKTRRMVRELGVLKGMGRWEVLARGLPELY